MDGRFEQQMRDRAVAKDTRLLGAFTALYCRRMHEGADRGPLESVGASLGVYAKPPVVCEKCAELLRYAERRRALCPKDPKPFCSYCDTHCYRPEEREFMRDIMRYSGPRSMLHGYAIDGMRHLIEGRRHKAAARLRAASENVKDTEEAT